jgi:hypothetical protein
MRVRSTLLGVAVCLLLSAGMASAQQTGEIYGKVTDTSGAVLPGATVTLSGGPLIQPLTVATSESGTYRFPQLLVGEYSVKFELPGFRTIVNEKVYVGIGFNAQVNASLEVSTIQETITVTSEAPIVDTKEAGTGTSFTDQLLQDIPSSRDPWTILQRVPAVAMDRENIGGSQSGQQSNYISRGANTTQNKWSVDGVDVTDQAATGASPVYFDFDTFEEMQVSTGGMDASQQTGGVGINIVTKSGTDVLRGSGRYYWTDEKFEADNVTPELRAQRAGAGNPIQNIKDFGVEGGGPIIPGRAWAWGAYGKQDIKVGVIGFYKQDPACRPAPGFDPILDLSTKDLRDCLNTDLTTLDNYNMKGSGLLFKGNRATWHSFFADKVRNARDVSDLRPIETAWKQVGPVWTHKFSDQHVFSDRWLAEVQIAHVGGGFKLDFQDESLANVQPLFEISTSKWARSYFAQVFDRPADSVDLTTTYFLPAKLGGDHSFKAGFRWRDTPSIGTVHRGGNTVARTRNTLPAEAYLYRDEYTASALTNIGVYAQDTFTRNRLSVLLGVRVDQQDDAALAGTVAAHPFAPEWLPEVNFAGADAGVTWTDVSPRVGVTYDLRGTGRTLLRASYSTYYGQIGPGNISGILNPVNEAFVGFPWNDLNGDLLVTRDELDLRRSAIITSGGNYNPDDPTAIGTINRVDPTLKNERTREFIAGFDHQIGNSFAVGASYVYRKYDRFRWGGIAGADNNYFIEPDGVTPAGDFTSDFYVPVSFTPTDCRAGAMCPTVTYYNPTVPIPSLQIRTNRPDFFRTFNGFEVSARKRYSHRWLLDASVAYNDAVETYDSPRAYQDPTNIENLSDAQYAPQSAGSGIDNIYTNAKWLVKVAGAYTMPWDINVAAFYNGRQGYPFPREIQTPARINRAATTSVFIEPLGELRHPDFHNVDLRVAKAFRFMNTRKFEVSLDVFNVANSNTILARRRNQRAANANDVSAIVAPRVLRFGARIVW